MIRHILPFVLILSLLLLPACGKKGTTTSQPQTSTTLANSTTSVKTVTTSTAAKPVPVLKLEEYNGGFFTIKKPAGWDIVTAGECSTFSFYIRDKQHPTNQILYFGEVGPVYMAEKQKEIDKGYMDIGGRPIVWYSMPVVDPLTPENLLANFHLISNTDIAQALMPGLPAFDDVQVISSVETATFIPGGHTKIVRALFREGGELGEGLFFITVAELLPVNGYAGAGIGYSYCFTGITATRSDFKFLEKTLSESLGTLNLFQEYIDKCLTLQQQQGQAMRNISDTLSDCTDIITSTYESRDRSDDIYSEKWSDQILGKDRLYNPETGDVYEVPEDFYDKYDTHREDYNIENLQPLPDDNWDLWTAPTIYNPDLD